jgi:ceramide glucosyltransferase
MYLALAAFFGLLTMAGIGQALAGWRETRRFAAAGPTEADDLPPLTLLKPLHGDEPLLEAALASVIDQDYPRFQVIFGVQRTDDPAVAVVERLKTRFPDADIALVVDATPHGENRKVANLINMYASAKYDHIVIADSDLHCAPDYLRRVAAEFAAEGVGLVTSLYAGLAADATLPGKLGASAINHSFLPGALMSRALGREDCLGATMALRRDTLEGIGGLHALVDHLADDNMLGQLVRAQGLRIRIAATVPATTVPESTLAALFRHELRWSRTILSLVPFEFAASAIQYPLFWAIPAWVFATLAGHERAGEIGFLLVWFVRAWTATGIDTALGLVAAGRATPAPIWLLPLRDMLSMAVFLASYASDTVEWRGNIMHTHAADQNPTVPPAGPTDAPVKAP